MIDPEGHYCGVCRYDIIKNFAPNNKRLTTVAGLNASECVLNARTLIKSTRCTDISLDPNHGVLNGRFVADLNHLPNDITRLDMSRRCCALYRWATKNSLGLVCCVVLFATFMCVSFYHLFHAVAETRNSKSELKKCCLKAKYHVWILLLPPLILLNANRSNVSIAHDK